MHIDHSEYTILLADDSISNLEKMKSLLAGENFKLLPTLEADEVFLLAKLRLPDMIIIRLALEGGYGCPPVETERPDQADSDTLHDDPQPL
jgi:two-component system sensor histidine kinase/response regulator